MNQYNAITLRAYSSGTTFVSNAGLDQAQDVVFDKSRPGGECISMSFFVPRDITASWGVKIGQRITAWNSLVIVWEGYITGIAPTLTADNAGVFVTCEGAWSRHLQRRYTRKPWADTRLGQDVWIPYITVSAGNVPDKCNITQSDWIKFVPNSTRDAAGAEVGWANNDYVRLTYAAPTGQTIKRITCEYDMVEGGQAWELQIYNATAAAALVQWTVGTAGVFTAYDSGTIATPTTALWIRFVSRAAQTPPTDGTVIGQVRNIVVYTEIGSINAQEIAKDVRASVTALSADETQIGALTLSLVPFIAEGAESYADLLTRAAGYGDASYNRWECYLGVSQDVSDNLPRLCLTQSPALTDYDYAVRVDEENVTSDLAFTQDLDPVKNWIAVHYADEDGRSIYVTPDDDATLTDAASVAAYGRREEWIDVPTTDLTAATNYGRSYLAQYKDPQWTCTGGLSVVGYIRGKTNSEKARVPASEIRPGKRLKVENWLNDINGTGLTLLISGTSYTDTGETCAIEIGIPDNMTTTLARLQRDSERSTI